MVKLWMDVVQQIPALTSLTTCLVLFLWTLCSRYLPWHHWLPVWCFSQRVTFEMTSNKEGSSSQMNMVALRSCQISISVYHSTRRNSAKDLNPRYDSYAERRIVEMEACWTLCKWYSLASETKCLPAAVRIHSFPSMYYSPSATPFNRVTQNSWNNLFIQSSITGKWKTHVFSNQRQDFEYQMQPKCLCLC